MRGSKPDRNCNTGQAGKPNGRDSIATRLLWSYLLLAITPLLVIGVLLIYSNFDTQRTNVYAEQRNLANRTARDAGLFVPLPAATGAGDILLTLPLRNDAGTLIGVMRAVVDAAPIAEELRGMTVGTNSTAYIVQSGTGKLVLDDGQPSFQLPPDRADLSAAAGSARDIQLGLLSDRAPWGNEEIAVFARSIPAHEVGGDFYTYIALSEGREAIAVGDISGKGVGAALLMSLTSSAVESHGRELEHPAEVLASLNQLLAPRLKANHINAALMFAVFDPPERLLRVANAGMIAPVLIGTDGSRFLDVGGLPIGAIPGAVYHDLSVELQPGDTLLLMSDGVVEAHNERGDMFGFERLEQLLAESGTCGDVRALVELVLSQVQGFIGEAEQHDDITLVAVRPSLALDDHIFVEQEAPEYATL